MSDIQKITTPDQLAAFAAEHHLREDWHEPDEVNIDARTIGAHLNNAYGPTTGTLISPEGMEFGEHNVILQRQDGDERVDIAVVNLADLLAWASTPR